MEDQARSVLHLLVEAQIEFGQPPVAPVEFTLCPNCDEPVERVSSPYCSDACQSQASFVRQFRAASATGTILTPEKQLVFGERLWWLLGGGLPLRESRITPSGKRQVTKRAGGNCEFCGAPMTAVENFGSGCNRPFNLRAVCDACSRTAPYGDVAFCQRPTVIAAITDLSRRVYAPAPIRVCDDPENWDWRAFIAQRRG